MKKNKESNVATLSQLYHNKNGYKKKKTAGIFALLLGTIGIHKFYLGKGIQGLGYILFSWTFIPTIVGIVEGINYLRMDDKKWDSIYNLKSSIPEKEKPKHLSTPLSLSVIAIFIVLFGLLIGGLLQEKGNVSEEIVDTSAMEKPITDNNANEEEGLCMQRIKKKEICDEMSGWNGSYKPLVKYVKDNMNDSGSFKHIETLFSRSEDNAIFLMKYSGKNAFNATVKESVKIRINLDTMKTTFIQ